ncbi:tRNA (adenosine(37)-N6)-threonylcarbamoyltransferase complex ATPase subunit type 1 TsaE [candidate division WOR-1 bacterium RIFOXYA12_FULL_52_29]|uniref:tRNA threonylcarbamoyladenosine biosynthesis protein TsaE n=1 Tax=candidate division WOR-1 bacterium RIFOXYC12_FULL_54_18 TaxID=1802584 RepID=A0A1F4T5N0_UNCSA|nr:MAG: tRNA (adenosine(37)-N6)-threonylcarbamoyltransferase complex ATPase subunit type 1 TsaE [candidate division WOR-1 bacterium RIFOXYA2_FULL_51_19]OGC17704.1 MAG: tRNA (adenosine(37)-N6)-threonylcarbamoyltransferase complex ATPase subunit type 1 TsaE [candidate division WOR-1 bacterium RIFOXYA12_FULL_52_29]OGC26561.1 MAG: tRNA (adenosine(37)-N6)-threonylcarbamoyltransferase complex ATPase subunit type 1 TsaE [candidate division WOR-1 bacterium RIFOXYB2_FULL_45_9]OGC28121.1 MAG: tRNA (adenos
MKTITRSAEETVELGRKIGAVLRANEVVALTGGLGAGKTTLIQGIAQGFGVNDYVTSPTFIIINEYQGRLPLYHFDLYRLEDPGSIEELGVDEYFQRGGVCLIEWAERMTELLPVNRETIEIKLIDENEREICLSSGLAARLK